jgi:sigma-E factor negative regulatory protein RseC
MLTETGRVVAVERDSLWVETIRQSTCGSCAARKGCGHGLLNRMSDGKYGYIRVLPGKLLPTDCRVDDQVRFAIPAEVILRGSVIVYVLPLLLLLVGAGAGTALAGTLLVKTPDLFALGGAVLGLATGALLVRWHAHAHRSDRTLQPTLLERLHPAEQALRL